MHARHAGVYYVYAHEYNVCEYLCRSRYASREFQRRDAARRKRSAIMGTISANHHRALLNRLSSANTIRYLSYPIHRFFQRAPVYWPVYYSLWHASDEMWSSWSSTTDKWYTAVCICTKRVVNTIEREYVRHATDSELFCLGILWRMNFIIIIELLLLLPVVL